MKNVVIGIRFLQRYVLERLKAKFENGNIWVEAANLFGFGVLNSIILVLFGN